MSRVITQRELRNESAAVLREVEAGPDDHCKDTARMYGRMFAAARVAGQRSRSRLTDLLIASTAAANGLPVYTRNRSDFDALKAIVKVVPV